MNVTYSCPACGAANRQELDPTTVRQLVCLRCSAAVETPEGAVVGERVVRCLACPSHDLFVRKDFPQRLGVALVAIGVVGSSIAWFYARIYWTYAILFATALADVALYSMVGNVLMCYRCGAHYRGAAGEDAHGPFRLETHEKQRQMAARMHSTSS